MYKIFVISIAGHKRRDKIKKQLNDQGLPFTFWDAIDGRNKKITEFKEVDLEKIILSGTGNMNGGQVALYISVIRLFKHCLKNGYERVIVLEDDAELMGNFKEAVKHISQLSKVKFKYEWIRFYYGSRPCLEIPKPTLSHSSLKNLIEKVRNKLRLRWSWGVLVARLGEKGEFELRMQPSKENLLPGCVGFLVNRRAMKKLVYHSYPIFMPLDWYFERCYMHGVRQLLVLPTTIRTSYEKRKSIIENIKSEKISLSKKGLFKKKILFNLKHRLKKYYYKLIFFFRWFQ